MVKRYLTKSRFKLAMECPNKLFYTRKNKEFTDKSTDDNFLKALAEGGFQVGELAKLYKPNGKDVKTIGDEALEETKVEMAKENAIIYEGAFEWNGCYIRADVIVKKGDRLFLYEVKAKSYNGDDAAGMVDSKGNLSGGWAPYVFDVAFQKYILQNIYPQYKIKAYLTLADKNKKASVDGLNQKFFLNRKGDNTFVELVGDTSSLALGDHVLSDVNVDELVEQIHTENHTLLDEEYTFSELIDYLSSNYINDIEIEADAGPHCLGCQFRDDNNYDKSGFHKCWKRSLNFSDEDFKKTPSFEVWGGGLGNRSLKKEFFEKNRFFIDDIYEEDVAPKNISQPDLGMSSYERRMYQIEQAKSGVKDSVFLKDDYLREKKNWVYPLHFIDFETTSLAIPMHAGMSPYEGVAFQFSHHSMAENGEIKHAGQWLNVEKGKFPNFEFVRALKDQLSHDSGTIFRYHNHENTYLNMVYIQLKHSDEQDKEELMSFIASITKPSGVNKSDYCTGARNMVDLYVLVTKYYIHPAMKGSNSIKKVLPAVLNDSEFLQNKYSNPIYGGSINSLNFLNHTWVVKDNDGAIKDPYKLLDNVFEGMEMGDLNDLITNSNATLNDGGAAMMAYANIQFHQMSNLERDKIIEAMYKYCELDTLAMAMILEHWNYIAFCS